MNIKYNDIVNHLKKLLKTNFPTYKIYSDEIKENMIRPAFHINLMPETSINFNVFYREQNVLIDISYFSDDLPDMQSKTKNLDMANTLQNIFNTDIKIYDNYINVSELDFDIVDRVLHTTFNLMWYNNNEITQADLDKLEDMHTVIFADGLTITDYLKLKEANQLYVNTSANEQIFVKEE